LPSAPFAGAGDATALPPVVFAGVPVAVRPLLPALGVADAVPFFTPGAPVGASEAVPLGAGALVAAACPFFVLTATAGTSRGNRPVRRKSKKSFRNPSLAFLSSGWTPTQLQARIPTRSYSPSSASCARQSFWGRRWSKGLDFEHVTLVGVLDADISLHANTFRSTERTFSLLAQVVGRSGRGEKEGRAVIQTLMPKHPVILSAAKQDYDGFYESEIGIRKQLGYPPFKEIVAVTFSGASETSVHRAALRFRGLAERLLEVRFQAVGAEILGPAPAAVLKVNNQFRYMILFKMEFLRAERDYISALIKGFLADKQNRGVSLGADYNPSDI
jgi:hypothetical protein